MNNQSYVSNVLSYLRKKWWLIVLCGLLCACILLFEKSRPKAYVQQTGDVVIGKTLVIDNYKDRYDIFRYDTYIRNGVTLVQFYKTTSNRFDYSKFDPAWNTKQISGKMEWLRKHLFVNYSGAGHFDVMLMFTKSEVKDTDYLKQYGEKYVDDFVAFLQEADPHNKLTIQYAINEFPDDNIIPKTKINLKYGIIGFFLGSFASTTALSLLAVRRKNG